MKLKDLPTVKGGFKCVVADPPWPFKDKGSRIAPDNKAKPQYNTLSVFNIAALDLPSVCAKDALLLLWTTSTHLLDGSAAHVARMWGFEPKVTIAWVKTAKGATHVVLDNPVKPKGVVFGMGHYVRGAHEIVLVATRGKVKVKRHDLPSVIFAPRGTHSTKPELLQDMAEQLTVGPYLELFARRPRNKWTVWGDQL